MSKRYTWIGEEEFASRKDRPMDMLLIFGESAQSHTLKRILFDEAYKKPLCEICGWGTESRTETTRVKLDYKNGNYRDLRLDNLRILCPNCYSIQPNNYGRNKGLI